MKQMYHVFGTITNLSTYQEQKIYLHSFSRLHDAEDYLRELREEVEYMQENFPDEEEVCGWYTVINEKPTTQRTRSVHRKVTVH